MCLLSITYNIIYIAELYLQIRSRLDDILLGYLTMASRRRPIAAQPQFARKGTRLRGRTYRHVPWAPALARPDACTSAVHEARGAPGLDVRRLSPQARASEGHDIARGSFWPKDGEELEAASVWRRSIKERGQAANSQHALMPPTPGTEGGGLRRQLPLPLQCSARNRRMRTMKAATAIVRRSGARRSRDTRYAHAAEMVIRPAVPRSQQW
jgi:hypothetical protein